MRYVLLLVIIAGALFAWRKHAEGAEPEPSAEATDPNTTPAANAANRMDTLSGAAPSP